MFFSIHPEVKQISPIFKEQYKNEIINDITNQRMFLWNSKTVIKGIDIIQNNVFRELMGEEVLLPDQSLEIMKSTILFTDIKSSTQLYTDLGDSKAFKLVREHFRIIFGVIKKYNGVPVKTIDDAVMSSFASQTYALNAALECQSRIIQHYKTKNESEIIEIKIGFHSGATLVVTLNGKLDYFGSTVNMAARVQSIAQSNEITISETIFQNNENKKIIQKYTNSIRKTKEIFKGINGKFNIFHIAIK